eukprot:9505486-Ditylum_brightwellii.AAC.1
MSKDMGRHSGNITIYVMEAMEYRAHWVSALATCKKQELQLPMGDYEGSKARLAYHPWHLGK